MKKLALSREVPEFKDLENSQSMNFEKIVGVIAGDDTIFAVVPDDSDAIRLIEKIQEVLD